MGGYPNLNALIEENLTDSDLSNGVFWLLTAAIFCFGFFQFLIVCVRGFLYVITGGHLFGQEELGMDGVNGLMIDFLMYVLHLGGWLDLPIDAAHNLV